LILIVLENGVPAITAIHHVIDRSWILDSEFARLPDTPSIEIQYMLIPRTDPNKLPRRQQEKVAEFVEAFVKQQAGAS